MLAINQLNSFLHNFDLCMHALFKVSPKNLIKVKIYLMILVSSAMKLQCRHKKTLKEGIQHEIRGIET